MISVKKTEKGQMVFEFVLATVFFFAVIFYVINYLNVSLDVFGKDFYSNKLESKAIQISELLVRNEGVWQGSTPLVLGLVEDWPVLSYTKIQNLNQTCSNNYTDVIELLDLGHHRVKIQINESGRSEPLLDCGQFTLNMSQAEVRRFAISEGNEILTIGVWIW